MTSLEWKAIRCDWEPSHYGCNPFDQFDPPQTASGPITGRPELYDPAKHGPIVPTPPHYAKLMNKTELIFGPPLLFLLVGGLLFWAVRGFRTRIER